MQNIDNMIKELLKTKDRVIVSIDGRCAAGKSTLANDLKEKYNATVFHMDDYFLPEIMKTKDRLAIPGSNVHYERFIDEVLIHLNKDTIVYQKFNCTTQSLEPMIHETLSKVIIIEGVYSQQDLLREYYDLNIFMTIEVKIQQERLKNRNIKLYNRFISEWIPLEEKYFTEQKIESQADIIIST